MATSRHICSFLVLAVFTLHLHCGLATFGASRIPILSYLVRSTFNKFQAGLAAQDDVEHIHHYHFEPVPVAVVAIPIHNHLHVPHKLGNDLSLYSENTWWPSSYGR